MIHVEIHDEDISRLLRRYKDKLGPGVARVIREACERMATEARRRAPSAFGELRGSIFAETKPTADGVQGRVGAGGGPSAGYALFVHGWSQGGQWVGPKRHFVPFKVAPGLLRWLELNAKGSLTGANRALKKAKTVGADLTAAKMGVRNARLRVAQVAALDPMKGGIMVGGKPPTPYLIPLLAKYKPEILEDLRKALKGV
jgi:hypothetical protein